MDDILIRICTLREQDYRRKGKEFGCTVPSARRRPLVPFLSSPGAILEIKRSSPSKGVINSSLDPVRKGLSYRKAGAKQISVLTEGNFFGGSLDDLIAVGDALDDVALLRKDFIQHPDEVEVSYRAGADAVLLICAVLDEQTLQSCVNECTGLGLVPLIEVRDEADVQKVNKVSCKSMIVGINSRNLSTFRIDLLRPARLLPLLTCDAVYESGIHHPRMCTYARSLGFRGVLIGESVSRDESIAQSFVKACASEPDAAQGDFWKKIAVRKHSPLVKICGITRTEDAECAVKAGADLLGFVFAESRREADEKTAGEIRTLLDTVSHEERPLLIGVITETEGKRFTLAQRLYREGILDALQYHGVRRDSSTLPPGYHAVRLRDHESIAEVQRLMKEGEPRVLIDGYRDGEQGGTGEQVKGELLDIVSEEGPLWLAGGLSVDTVAKIIAEYDVELVDASSSLEESAGKKNPKLVTRFIQECRE